MFGNFNLNAGFSQLQDLGGRFQKIREDLEQNIESSLRTNLASTAEGVTAAAGTSNDGGVPLTGTAHLLHEPSRALASQIAASAQQACNAKRV